MREELIEDPFVPSNLSDAELIRFAEEKAHTNDLSKSWQLELIKRLASKTHYYY
jgi:hypothetical protein